MRNACFSALRFPSDLVELRGTRTFTIIILLIRRVSCSPRSNPFPPLSFSARGPTPTSAPPHRGTFHSTGCTCPTTVHRPPRYSPARGILPPLRAGGRTGNVRNKGRRPKGRRGRSHWPDHTTGDSVGGSCPYRATVRDGPPAVPATAARSCLFGAGCPRRPTNASGDFTDSSRLL